MLGSFDITLKKIIKEATGDANINDAIKRILLENGFEETTDSDGEKVVTKDWTYAFTVNPDDSSESNVGFRLSVYGLEGIDPSFTPMLIPIVDGEEKSDKPFENKMVETFFARNKSKFFYNTSTVYNLTVGEVFNKLFGIDVGYNAGSGLGYYIDNLHIDDEIKDILHEVIENIRENVVEKNSPFREILCEK